MEFSVNRLIDTIEKEYVLNSEYAKSFFALSSHGQLSSFKELGVRMEHIEITAVTKSYKSLKDKYPDDDITLSAPLHLLQNQSMEVVPVAVLVKNVSNTFPVTLEWKFSGCDQWFTQTKKAEKGILEKFWNNTPKVAPLDERYFNTNTLFTEYVGGHNKYEFMGFNSGAFRKVLSTTEIKRDAVVYCCVDVNYKYFKPLWNAFSVVHRGHPALNCMLLYSDKIWKVEKSLLDKVLQWIDENCHTDLDKLKINTDKFEIQLRKYDGRGWYHIGEQYDENRSANATVSIIVLYKTHY